MRILIDQAIYDMRNKGNVALLQTAVNRLQQLWPDARIDVLTEAPHILKLYAPAATPVSVYKWHDWSNMQARIQAIHKWTPTSLLRLYLEFRAELAHRRTSGSTNGYDQPDRVRRSGEPAPTTPVPLPQTVAEAEPQNGSDFWQAVKAADLVVASGGGYLCDADKPYVRQVLGRLKIALELGKRVVLVGQGVGPLSDAELTALLREILPAVELILVREQRVAMPLLEALGTKPARILMTGDDAIELAYEARQNRWGKGIGVNLRVASYTQVGRQSIEQLRIPLQQAAHRYHAPLIAVPISQNTQEADLTVARELLAGYPNRLVSWRRFDTPDEVIRTIARCRIVVTGAYHGAVFALAQGIPVVGLVKSVEYQNKFGGLVDEFGPGCQIVHLNDPALLTNLAAAIDSLWQAAEILRPQLLAAAQRQIDLGHRAYQQLYRLIEQKRISPLSAKQSMKVVVE